MSDWECPKCKTEYIASGPHDEDSGEHDCYKCGFRFKVEIEYDPSYEATCVEHEWLPPFEQNGLRVEKCKHCEMFNWEWRRQNQ